MPHDTTCLFFFSPTDACLRCQAENKQEDCVGKKLSQTVSKLMLASAIRGI